MNIQFRKTFEPIPDTVYGKYKGLEFTVLRELSDEEADEECRPMYKIELENGLVMDAFPEEITL